jgi:hypothetical protein
VGLENKVEVEVGKTEVVVFSKRRKVFQAARDAVVHVGEQTFAINKSATKWVGFWLDTKLSSNLLRIKKAQNVRCWWCGRSPQTVAHLMLECRKWRRQLENTLQKLTGKDITISEMRNRTDLEIMFEQGAMIDILEYVECTLQSARSQRKVRRRVIRGTPKSSIGVEMKRTRVLMVAEVEEDTQQRWERRRAQERTLSRLVKVEIASRVVPEKMKARAQMEARKKIIRHVISYTA